jgi:peroxiredoxin family protein
MQEENQREPKKRGVTIVVFSGELDRALAAFNIATTAASMGRPVSMFFTFWGLNIIKKEEGKIGEGNWLKRMLNSMNRGGAKRLKLSKMNMAGVGTYLMKSLMAKHRMPSLQEMLALAEELGVQLIACTTTMALMGLSEEDFIPAVREFAGAATYVSKALESDVNLYI